MDGTDGKYEIDTNEDGHVVFLKSNYGYDGIFDPFSSHDWNFVFISFFKMLKVLSRVSQMR